MRILQIIYSLDLGGIEEFTGSLAGCFAADGFDSHILLISRGRDEEWCMQKRRHIEETATVITDISGYGRIKKLLKMTRLIKDLKPDVVILHHELNTLRLLPARLMNKFMLIQIQHNTKFNGQLRHRFFGKYLVDIYTGPSKDVAQAVADTLRVPVSDVRVIENGIPLKEFEPSIKNNPKINILAAGRFTKQKNFVDLTRIFMEFLSGDLLIPVEVIIAGDGEDMDEVKKMTAGNTDISLTGALPDLRPLYKKADIYVSYSLHEGLSLTLLEAMASGCAILSTATSGTREIIKNQENGMLVDINDCDSFMKALNKMVSNKELRESLAAGAVKTAADFDFSKTYDKYKNLVESLISNE